MLLGTLGILGGCPLALLGEDDETGVMELLPLAVEERGGAEVVGGVALADMGGVGTDEVGVVLDEVEILLLLLTGLLLPTGAPPLDLGKGVVGRATPPWGAMPLDIIGPIGPIIDPPI